MGGLLELGQSFLENKARDLEIDVAGAATVPQPTSTRSGTASTHCPLRTRARQQLIYMPAAHFPLSPLSHLSHPPLTHTMLSRTATSLRPAARAGRLVLRGLATSAPVYEVSATVGASGAWEAGVWGGRLAWPCSRLQGELRTFRTPLHSPPPPPRTADARNCERNEQC